ncbi:restriction endonuclease subunit R, partial [Epilithonimonas hispanica]
RFASDFRSQNQQTSNLGINTWMAAQYIQDKNDGRNVTLLSATPFTNKPLEYYSILSLIANKRLEESGYFNVNTFFETFMEADNDMEIDAKGDVKFKANVRRFKNNSLFQQLLSEFIDIKGEEDNPELIRPNKINKEYKI